MKVKRGCLDSESRSIIFDRILPAVCLALALITIVLVCAYMALVAIAAHPEPADQRSINHENTQYCGIIRAIPNSANSEPRLVLDQSYWRLARQGKARIIPGTEKYLESGDPDADPYNLANFRDIDLDAVTLQAPELGWYNIYGSPGTSGTIVCRLHSETQEVTVSVPVLSPELKALADSRGDHYVLVRTECVDDESTAQLLFYQERAILLLIQPDNEPLLLIPKGALGCIEYSLYADSNYYSIISMACDRYTACTPVARLRTNRSIPDFCSVGQLQATPTTFSASPEQVAVLKAQLDQVESEYLSSEILENLTTSPE